MHYEVKKNIYILGLLFLSSSISAYSQTETKSSKTLVILKVMDESGKVLPYSTVRVEQLDLSLVGNEKGIITFSNDFAYISLLTVELSYVGKESKKINVKASDTQAAISIQLSSLDLELKAIEVNAIRKKSSSNSSVYIGRQAIEGIQSYSMADVMQLLPGKAIMNADLQNAQFLSLRSAAAGGVANPLDTYKNSKINDFMRNNAFGIGFFIDGSPISNNANMQADSYGKWGTVKVFDRHLNPDNSNYVSSGIDLRQVPSSSIESVEVISGVAPVKYGDISDGAVLINRKAGVSPYFASVKFQVGTINLSVGKGFDMGKKRGILSYNIDYLSGTSSSNTIGIIATDKRNTLKNYNRINADFIWTKTLSPEYNWGNSASLNINTDIDGLKNDPDAYLKRTKTRNRGFRFANRGQLYLQKNWIDNINYNFSASLTQQYNFHEEYMPNAPQTFIADAIEPGIYETDVTPPYYTSKMEIHGMPLYLFGRVEAGKTFSGNGITNNITMGLNINYDDNLGRGKIFDPNAPYYQSNIAGRGERSYNFSNKVHLMQIGAYLQNAFDIKIGSKKLSSIAGLRIDKQGKWINLSPRINAVLSLSEHWQLNAAFGISSKAPSTAYLFPENVYFDNLLIGRYDPNYKKRLYLIQTEVRNPQNPKLKSVTGTTFEIGTQYHSAFFNLSVTAYQKENNNGIAAKNILEYIQIPEYKVVITNPEVKPFYYPTGKSKLYPIVYYQPQNILYSRNRGIELLLSTQKIESIQTAFNLSAAYTYSYYYSKGRYPGSEINLEREAIVGIYEFGKQQSQDLVTTLSVTHHIPLIGFVLNWKLQNFWLRKSLGLGSSALPVAYINQQYEEVPITKEDIDNGKFTDLILDKEERYGVQQPKIITNYHIRLSKEILKHYTISFYANNLFNYRPYITHNGLRTYFNQPPTFGVDLAVKL